MATILRLLNENSAAVQAVSAVLSLVVTGVLVWITWRYVQLTRSLAETARAQFQLQATAERKKLNRLLSLIHHFEERIGQVAISRESAEQLRLVVTWQADDVAELKRLAGEAGQEPAELANRLTAHLAWLEERVVEVKSTDPRTGVNWERFPWEHWVEHLKDASIMLGKLQAATALRMAGIV